MTDEIQLTEDTLGKKISSFLNREQKSPFKVRESPHEIKAISCDLDDVLIPTTIYTRLAHKHGILKASRAINGFTSRSEQDDNIDRLYKKLTRIIVERGANHRKHFDELFINEGYGGSELKNLVEIARTGYRTKAEEVFKSNIGMKSIVTDLGNSVDGKIGIVTAHERKAAQIDKLVLSALYSSFDSDSIFVVGNGDYKTKGDGLRALSMRHSTPLRNIAHIDDRFTSISQANTAKVQTIYFMNESGKYCVGERKENYQSPDQAPNWMIRSPREVIQIVNQSKN